MAENSLQRDDTAACDECGCVSAWRFDGTVLCADCYQARGACCAERVHEWTGGDDWPRCDRAPRRVDAGRGGEPIRERGASPAIAKKVG